MKELEVHIDDLAITLHSLETRLKGETEGLIKAKEDARSLRTDIEECGKNVHDSQNRLEKSSIKVVKLRSDHEIVKAEVRSLGAELLNLKQLREATEHELQECRLSLSKSKSVRSQLDRDRVVQARELERFELIIKQLTEDIDFVNKAIADRQTERRTYEDILRETVQASQFIDRDIRRCEGNLRGSNRSLEKRMKILVDSANMIRTNEDGMKLVDHELGRITSELDQMNELIAGLESREIMSLVTKKRMLLAKLESVRKDSESIKPIIEVIDDRIRTISDRNADLDKTIGQLDNNLESMRRLKARISGEHHQLNTEVLTIVSNKSAADNELSAKIKLYKTHRVYLAQRKLELEEIEARSSQTAAERGKCEAVCEGLRQVVERTDREIKVIQVEIGRIMKDLARRNKKVELKKQNLDRVRSQVIARVKELEEAAKSHDKAKSSISLEGRVHYLEEELRLILFNCQESEQLKSKLHGDQLLLNEQIQGFRTELNELEIKKFILEGIRKRKNLAIAKCHGDEESTRREVSLTEREYSRMGEIHMQLRVRESEIVNKLREAKERLEENTKLLEIESNIRNNESIEAEITLLQSDLEESERSKCLLEASLQAGSNIQSGSVEGQPKRSELVSVIRKLKHALKSLEREKLERQRRAIARINEWDFDRAPSRKTLPGLRRGRYMASTCSTLASSTLSLANDDDTEVLNDRIECIKIEILQLKSQFGSQSQPDLSGCVTESKLRAIGQSLRKVGGNTRPRIVEEIVKWHQLNESLSL